jgi:hypothetical protein
VIGKWAGGLLLVCVAFLTWTVVGVNTGGLEPGSWPAMVAGLGTMVTGVATIVTSLLGRMKFHDRSWVLTVGMIVPALIVLVFVADFIADAI